MLSKNKLTVCTSSTVSEEISNGLNIVGMSYPRELPISHH